MFVGGNIVIGKQNFDEVKERFYKMGFNKVYAPGTSAPITPITIVFIWLMSPSIILCGL